MIKYFNIICIYTTLFHQQYLPANPEFLVHFLFMYHNVTTPLLPTFTGCHVFHVYTLIFSYVAHAASAYT